MGDSLCSWFDDPEFGDGDELFGILESLEEVTGPNPPRLVIPTSSGRVSGGGEVAEQKTDKVDADEAEGGYSPIGSKRRKVEEGGLREERVSHVTVERNRRKQMNEHLSVLRSLMPRFYVKRGDQASIIDGVVSYISELQQILQSLEAKKQRRAYNDVLSPRLSGSSPRPSPLSPINPCLSPRLNLPMCPRTPQPGSPYRTRIPPPLPPSPSPPPSAYLSPTLAKSPLDLSPCSSSTSSIDTSNELVANSKSPIAEVEVKFSGPNLVLKTKSLKIEGQVAKIVSALDGLSLEILQLSINAIQDTVLNSFTIKIGIECQLSAEELALRIQQTFC